MESPCLTMALWCVRDLQAQGNKPRGRTDKDTVRMTGGDDDAIISTQAVGQSGSPESLALDHTPDGFSSIPPCSVAVQVWYLATLSV